MRSITQETWDKLSIPVGEKLVARLAFPEITSRLLCAIDSKDRRHILISLYPDDEEYNEKSSRGIRVTTRELLVHGEKSDKYIDLECIDISGQTIINFIGGEIAENLRDNKKIPADSVKNVLERWRRFWGQAPLILLSKEEQIGLFGEIWFLSAWLIPKLGPEAILAWKGPWGSRHDFEWPDKSVEVKTTTNVRGRIHNVNGLRQLEKPDRGALYLFSVCLREENGAKINLPDLIVSCREQLNESEDAIGRLDSALVQMGYSPLHEDEYSRLKWHIIEDKLFEVTDDFPKIIPNSFPAGIPSGVERVAYEINLNNFANLIVANNPGKVPF